MNGTDNEKYYRTKMQKEKIMKELRDRGGRVTKQRRMLLDIILEEDCSSCKEIHFRAVKKNKNIGIATVYRMINTLEEIGAISRKNMYKIKNETDVNSYRVEFDDNTSIEITANKWNKIIKQGLMSCGYSANKDIRCVTAR